MSEYKITKISEVEQSHLSDFYKKNYFDRHESLINNWKWWYRIGYSKFEPLIISSGEKVLGQAGTQPIDLSINGKKVLASWFLDFSVNPELRGKGIGKNLTKKLMETCPNLITFCNEKTLKIVENFGWKDNFSTVRLAKPINPLKFLPIVKKIKLQFADNILRKIIKKDLKSTKINLKKIDNNYNVIKDSFKIRKILNIENSPKILRDEIWLDWRIKDCPYKKDLYFFEYKNNFLIAHIFSKKGINRLNILFTYFIDQSYENEIFQIILSWSVDNNIDLLWAIRKKEIDLFEKVFPKKFTKPVTFACWSSEQDNLKFLSNGLDNVQGIDSDLDSSMLEE